jgi:RNase P subunit RPR2
MPQLSITCPQCGATSTHPTDIADGYCGRCHEFTTRRPSTLAAQVLAAAIAVTCPICGAEPQAPCTWAGRDPLNDPDISHHARERAAPPE